LAARDVLTCPKLSRLTQKISGKHVKDVHQPVTCLFSMQQTVFLKLFEPIFILRRAVVGAESDWPLTRRLIFPPIVYDHMGTHTQLKYNGHSLKKLQELRKLQNRKLRTFSIEVSKCKFLSFTLRNQYHH
jgi:hypothetical protein